MAWKGWENYNPAAPPEKPKDPRRQLQGKINREIGATFEALILASCEAYKAKGLASVDKTPEPFKVTTGRHQNSAGRWVFEGHFIEPAQPDFQGTIKGGRSIVFEAKITQKDRIERKEVTGKQYEELERHHQMGALAFVFVSINLRTYHRVPWPVWRDMKALYGRLYMTKGELEKYRLNERNGLILLFDETTN